MRSTRREHLTLFDFQLPSILENVSQRIHSHLPHSSNPHMRPAIVPRPTGIELLRNFMRCAKCVAMADDTRAEAGKINWKRLTTMRNSMVFRMYDESEEALRADAAQLWQEVHLTPSQVIETAKPPGWMPRSESQTSNLFLLCLMLSQPGGCSQTMSSRRYYSITHWLRLLHDHPLFGWRLLTETDTAFCLYAKATGELSCIRKFCPPLEEKSYPWGLPIARTCRQWYSSTRASSSQTTNGK